MKGMNNMAETKAAGRGAELYTADEFAQAAEKLFPDKKRRPSRYLITAAFRMNKKTQVTKEDGVRMIKEFMERKVE